MTSSRKAASLNPAAEHLAYSHFSHLDVDSRPFALMLRQAPGVSIAHAVPKDKRGNLAAVAKTTEKGVSSARDSLEAGSDNDSNEDEDTVAEDFAQVAMKRCVISARKLEEALVELSQAQESFSATSEYASEIHRAAQEAREDHEEGVRNLASLERRIQEEEDESERLMHSMANLSKQSKFLENEIAVLEVEADRLRAIERAEEAKLQGRRSLWIESKTDGQSVKFGSPPERPKSSHELRRKDDDISSGVRTLQGTSEGIFFQQRTRLPGDRSRVEPMSSTPNRSANSSLILPHRDSMRSHVQQRRPFTAPQLSYPTKTEFPRVQRHVWTSPESSIDIFGRPVSHCGVVMSPAAVQAEQVTFRTITGAASHPQMVRATDRTVVGKILKPRSTGENHQPSSYLREDWEFVGVREDAASITTGTAGKSSTSPSLASCSRPGDVRIFRRRANWESRSAASTFGAPTLFAGDSAMTSFLHDTTPRDSVTDFSETDE